MAGDVLIRKLMKFLDHFWDITPSNISLISIKHLYKKGRDVTFSCPEHHALSAKG
jgi:hypothetical protein